MEERMQKIVGEYAFDDDEDDVLLPGFRFHPTDEELVGFYLRRKVANKPLSIEIIKEIDIYKYDPWDLPKVVTAGEKEFFFFCLRGRKYRNSIRPNRVTGSGFWKATGIDKPIYSAASSSDCIGLKKSLVYYRGSAGKGTKTEWMMHEFRLPSSSKNTDDSSTSETWTICRIFKRSVSNRRQQNNKQINYNPIYTDSVSSITTNASFANSNSLSHSNTGEMEFLSNYYSHEDHNQVHQEQYWNSIFQSTINCHDQNTSQSPSMDELFSGDCSWDEFGGIMNFMADLNSP